MTSDPLTELLRAGAQQLICRAVEAELQDLLVEHSERRTMDGKAEMGRNGYLSEQELPMGLRTVTVRIPKVCSQTGGSVTFRSVRVPPVHGSRVYARDDGKSIAPHPG
ncbi:MAG TPA: hypothetical protein ENI75_02640 [Mizugakiibacter sp.]|nr:hypothetical protein [Mizugakiibacter sp.]